VRFLISAAVMALISTAAGAADLPIFNPPPDYGVTAPVYDPAPIAYNWSGFSIGGFAGWAWAEADVSQLYNRSENVFLNNPSGPFGLDDEGFNGGVQVAYDRHWRSFVFGVGGEFGVLELDKTIEDPTTLPTPIAGSDPDTSFSSELYGAVTGRVGFAYKRLLVYAKGGVAFLDADGSTVDDCPRAFCGVVTVEADGSDVLFGWTAGAGIELALTDHWSFGGEYRFYDFEDLKVSGEGTNLLTYSQDIDIDTIHTVRGFANYRW
jgi:outer membrane immunogenic protein